MISLCSLAGQELENDRQKAEQLADRMSAEGQQASLVALLDSDPRLGSHSEVSRAPLCAQELLSMCINLWQEAA